MTTIQELQKQKEYNANSIKEKDNKVHLLYVSPKFNARGYYRAIVPALELNKTNTHKALISSIAQNDFALDFDTNAIVLDESLIMWSDYIILPTLMDDIRYLIKAIKSINSEAQIIMDIDKNYFHISKSQAVKEKINPIKIEQLLSNLQQVDMVSVSDHLIGKKLASYFKEELEEGTMLIYQQSSLISQFGYEELEVLQKNESETVRMGLIKPTEKELLFLKEVLVQMKTLFKEEIEIICFGKPHATKEVDDLVKELAIEVHPTVSFSKYFETLNRLKLDIVLLPVKEDHYYDEKTTNIIKELAALGIATIASETSATALFISDEKTGFLANDLEEWEIILEALIKDKALRKQIGENALKSVWKHHSFTKSSIDDLTSLLI